MTLQIDTEIAVIGAGVVGLATAHRLAAAGHEVVIADPNDPGSGASYGNAGTIADYAVMPVGTPSVLKNLPSLLFDRNSPLAIRRAAILGLAPWLLRFARQSLPGPAARNAVALAALLGDAGSRWRELADQIGAAEFLQARGALYLYQSEAAAAAARADLQTRRGFGIPVEAIGPDALAALEPGLPPMAGGAAFFPQAQFLSDPGMVVAFLAAAAWGAGVRHQRSLITSLYRRDGAVVLRGEGVRIVARRVVIAAGAHSRHLARMAGDRVPLETERGYHMEYDAGPGDEPASGPELPGSARNLPRLLRPACPTALGFYLCPMAGRLRVAGTVELGGLDPAPSAHRIAMLDKGARSIFADLPAPSRTWLGFRPSLPDSLPVIGVSRDGPQVLHAFGHGHIGLTLAPVTAAIIADLIAGQAPALDLSPYRAGRF